MPDDYVKRSDVHKAFQQKYAPEYAYCPSCGAKMDGGQDDAG